MRSWARKQSEINVCLHIVPWREWVVGLWSQYALAMVPPQSGRRYLDCLAAVVALRASSLPRLALGRWRLLCFSVKLLAVQLLNLTARLVA